MKNLLIIATLLFTFNFINAQSSTLIGKCKFTGTQPGKGTSLLIGSDIQLYHNGSFRRTSIGGGVDYYTGDGDIWIIYRNPKARSRYNFKTSNGKNTILL
jgi:hypothetical protein